MDTKFNLIDALTPKLCGKPVRSISTCFTLLIMLCLLNIPGATGQTIDFKQAQNDLNGAKTFDIEWTNGILNATHTQYYEGFGIPQRLMFTNLAGGTYTLRFKFQAGFSKGGNNGTHAYDFLMSHEQAIAVAENIGGTVNELSKLLTQGCSDNIAPCATLAAIAAPDTRIVRLQAPDMPALYLGDNVQDEIDCFESIYGDREIEIRGNAAITDADIEFDGYTDDFAYFTVTWTSTSSQIMVRYASRAAVGEGEYCGDPLAQSGYGAGKGAGSISGGNFHNIFVSLNGEGQEILGERDNQLMAGAIEIAPPPPPCGFDGPRRACPETGSLTYTVPNAIRAAGATYAWTIIPGNPSAGAVIENGTGTPPLTKSGVDLYSINVIPAGTDFIAGGTFQVRLDVTRFGLTTTCYLSGEGENGGVVSIVNIDATANPESPAEIDLNSASPTSQLGVTVWPGVVGDYTFLWSQDPPSGGSLSANNIYNPVFTATETGDYTFTVQATDEGLTCASSVIVRVTSSSPTCPEISGTATTCANTTGLVFSVTADPPANFSYSWSVNNGASIQGSAPHTGKSITVDAGASSFTVTLNMVPDNPSQPTIPCTYEVTVNPIPTCSIAGDDEVCSGSTGNVYTSTVLPAGGTVTHSWSISGNGTITSATNLASVTVTAGAAGSFTLRDDITRNGCPSYCEYTVTVDPIPTCSIAGDDEVCSGSTGNVYTSTVLPAGGTVTHSWSISGNGTITSATNLASVTVTAGAAGSFTLRDDITRDGCPSYCEYTVTVDPIPTCSIAGLNSVCEATTGLTYTSTVLPAGGTVTHSWSISGNGTITSATNLASVTVTAGAIGSFTLRDDITRDGCPSYCEYTVTVNSCGHGCTPGYWRNHAEQWNSTLDQVVQQMPGTLGVPGEKFITSTSFYTYFNISKPNGWPNTLTMLDAVNIGGGGCKALARAGVAALLNEAGFEDYPYAGTFAQLYTAIRNALVSGNCSSLASTLDGYNNASHSLCGSLRDGDALITRSNNIPSIGEGVIAELSVNAFPNPYSNEINFRIASPTAGKASLEVYDLIGRRLAIVFQGNIEANSVRTLNYKVPSTMRVPMIYKLAIGDKSFKGGILLSTDNK